VTRDALADALELADSPYPVPGAHRGPLAGVRAIVLTQAWAGTFCTELLGLMGAEVIQIETRQRLDSWRGGSYRAQVPSGLRDRPNARHGWNTNALNNSVNLNKYCLTLNLTDQRGLDIFKHLVPFSDVIAENFSPRVMPNFGLDYESLRRIKRDVILISLSAYGASGPYANIPGIGGTIEPMSGMSWLLGYEEGPPQNSGQMYPDPVAGYYGAAAALLALRHRDRTGEGQYIDLSMQEANMTFVADALLEYATKGSVRGRLGNHHLSLAPHNMYRCRDGDWVAVAVKDDPQWQRCCDALGHPEWASDERFADNAARKRNERALDAAIGEAAALLDAPDFERRLVEAGIAAGRVLDAEGVRRNEQLRARGFIVELEHPETGRLDYVGVPARFSKTPGAATLPAPQLGQHSWQVLSTLLGMPRGEYEALVADGVTGSGPPPGAEEE
jgi:crotonobetainyl-CoA:carnitine CoA-transferase CaiB-like acyl-CoA transferase